MSGTLVAGACISVSDDTKIVRALTVSGAYNDALSGASTVSEA